MVAARNHSINLENIFSSTLSMFRVFIEQVRDMYYAKYYRKGGDGRRGEKGVRIKREKKKGR